MDLYFPLSWNSVLNGRDISFPTPPLPACYSVCAFSLFLLFMTVSNLQASYTNPSLLVQTVLFVFSIPTFFFLPPPACLSVSSYVIFPDPCISIYCLAISLSLYLPVHSSYATTLPQHFSLVFSFSMCSGQFQKERCKPKINRFSISSPALLLRETWNLNYAGSLQTESLKNVRAFSRRAFKALTSY